MGKATLFYIVLLLTFVVTGLIGLIGCGEESEEAVKEEGAGSFVSSATPANNAKNVPTTAAIMVTFDKDIVTPSVANVAFTPGVSGDVSYDPDTRTMVFKPSAALSNNTDYSMTIDGISGIEGSSMSPVTIEFTTSVPDNRGPKVTLTFPENNQKDLEHNTEISITFDEPIDRIKFPKSVFFDPRIDVSLDE